jgi:hypothetical protein
MNKIMFFSNDEPDIGLFTRTTTTGKEYSLIEQFISYYCDSFMHSNLKTRLSVFIEPCIESGFPDVVFASYLPSITKNWSDKRELLDIYDLKLLSHLYNSVTAVGAKLISKLGFPDMKALKHFIS